MSIFICGRHGAKQTEFNNSHYWGAWATGELSNQWVISNRTRPIKKSIGKLVVDFD